MTGTTYRQSGVDIQAGDQFVQSIQSLAQGTHNPSVLSGIGGFAALFHLGKESYRDPVLVSGTDGVGTKLKLAVQYDRHDTIGVDLVAMCVNDILVQGAKPLFFLDYFSCSSLDLAVAHRVVSGITVGCRQASCALVGGETAEMPGVYQGGEYDLAGFCVGVVERDEIIDGAAVSPGDCIIGLASSGLHSNGYSFVRHLIKTQDIDVRKKFFDSSEDSLLDCLMTPTRIYVPSILSVIEQQRPIHAMAHITGGGLPGNIARVLNDGVSARINRSSWPHLPLFQWLQDVGSVSASEMGRVFNNGIGFVLIVPASSCEETISLLQRCGETVFLMGDIIESSDERVFIV